jgi:hypothetical protein
MNRWYDRHRKLKYYLESLQGVERTLRSKIVKEIMEVVKTCDGSLLDRFAEAYPLALRKQRWYDQNPYLWILYNGLQYASDEIIAKVIEYFETTL